MNPMMYRCPTTGMMVQGFRADNGAVDDTRENYTGIRCLACSRMHFVNLATGKVLAPGSD